MQNDAIETRIFIVGCARSGTTLLQGALAAHPAIASFPETHFFCISHRRNPLARLLTLPSANVKGFMAKWVTWIGRPDLAPLDDTTLLDAHYERSLLRILDTLAREKECRIWAEKTPEHLLRIPVITKKIPHARFLHVIRRGPDTVASLYQAANENPLVWKSRWRNFLRPGLSLRDCVQRWNRGMRITASYCGAPNHHVVRYESLTERPESVLRGVCSFSGIEFVPAMLSPEKAYSRIVRPFERWKENNAKPIHKARSCFEDVFTESQKRYVRANLIDIEIPDSTSCQ